MKFDGIKNDDVNLITLKHKGGELNFRAYIRPAQDWKRELIEERQVTIVFNDIYEIQSMIEMLLRMKELCIETMGCWKETRGERHEF